MEWIKQFSPIFTWFPTNTLGWIIVFSPISEEAEITAVAAIKGLKCCVNLLKSLNGARD